jgi:hypothetical protein
MLTQWAATENKSGDTLRIKKKPTNWRNRKCPFQGLPAKVLVFGTAPGFKQLSAQQNAESLEKGLFFCQFLAKNML